MKFFVSHQPLKILSIKQKKLQEGNTIIKLNKKVYKFFGEEQLFTNYSYCILAIFLLLKIFLFL